MKRRGLESVAVTTTVLGIVAAVTLPFSIEAVSRRATTPAIRTITLTAVMPQGVWTEGVVNAGNAWRRDFRPARPVLRLGEPVRLRLRSADVVHTFSLPELGIDPVEVYPGKTVTMTLTPTRTGTFEFYCTTVCGERHFAMRGHLEVTSTAGTPPTRSVEPRTAEYWRTPIPGEGATPWERGAALYRRMGCITCHGPGGRGGVRNPNSMNPTVPELASLARRTFLFTPSDVAAFQQVIQGHTPLEGLREAPDVPLFSEVRKQYLATRRLIEVGRRSTKLDPYGPVPPLDMPAWAARLRPADIDAILTYLLEPYTGAGINTRAEAVLSLPKGEAR